MHITFIGTGYVGLISGIMLCALGHEVLCLDTDCAKINMLQKGISPIFEPELDTYLKETTASGRLKFSSSYNEEIKKSAAIFITIWTPPKEDGQANLSYIFDSIDSLLPFIDERCIIVIKSTVPPGTCQKIVEILTERGLNYPIVSNPEFLKEGSAIKDFINPDRIVVGSNDARATNILNEIYRPLTSRNITLVNTDLNTSELIKYASNAFLATKIAFINEIANISEKVAANIKQLTYAMGLDSRIGKDFLKVGPGFGGSCFPKDILALSAIAKNQQTNLKILDAVIESNQMRPRLMIEKIEHIVGDLSDKEIAVLGLTYKANTDDVRSSPAIEIVKLLLQAGSKVTAFDPSGIVNAATILKELRFAESDFHACVDKDAIIILTEWEQFRNIDFKTLRNRLNNPVVIDLRNLLDKELMNKLGFQYYSIG